MTSVNHDPYWLPYLHFGYLPPQEPVLPFDPPSELVTLPLGLSGAASQAGDVLSRVVHDSLTPGKRHYIPLSGGLDSRALLAAALEAGADVETLTFGMPGTMDYEYGNRVARAVDVRHQTLNLLDHLPDTADLVNAVRNGGAWTYTFDAYFNRLLSRQMGQSSIVLHGFAGDPVAGSHFHPDINGEEGAVAAFITSQQFSPMTRLIRSTDDPSSWIPAMGEIPAVAGLTAYERLDFCLRQTGAIRPIVIDPAVDVRIPFTHPDWLALMFAAPAKWREGCRLYEAGLVQRWPEFFKLPTKNHIGLGLTASVPLRSLQRLSRRVSGRISSVFGRESWLQRTRHNYIDFALAFRKNGALSELAKENLSDLEVRGVIPWLSPMQLLLEHSSGKKNYERELQLLIGLEINLKAVCE